MSGSRGPWSAWADVWLPVRAMLCRNCSVVGQYLGKGPSARVCRVPVTLQASAVPAFLNQSSLNLLENEKHRQDRQY